MRDLQQVMSAQDFRMRLHLDQRLSYTLKQTESESALLAKYVHTNKECDSSWINSQCTLNLRRK